MKEVKTIRHFSETFKKEKVKMIEEKKVTVVQLCRLYEVSRAAVYKWINKYSTLSAKAERVVIEKESEAVKTLALMERVAELERTIGQKQLQVDYLEKLIEFGSHELGFDIKKNFNTKLSTGLKTTQNK